jgi:hypothetical protein
LLHLFRAVCVSQHGTCHIHEESDATELSFVEYILETARLGSRLTYKKMFGEYALYLDEKVVAFACDNSLFIKPSKAVAKLAPDLPQGTALPRRQGLSDRRRTARRSGAAAPAGRGNGGADAAAEAEEKAAKARAEAS